MKPRIVTLKRIANPSQFLLRPACSSQQQQQHRPIHTVRGHRPTPNQAAITTTQKKTMSTSLESKYIPLTTETTYHIAKEIIRLLKQSNQTLAVAESLTGGGLMTALTSVEGCSAVFRGGVVSYATPIKESLLNVDGELIAKEGVINGEVAAQMAAGVRDVTTTGTGTGTSTDRKTSWGLGTTGVAGPDPQDGKPVGMVFIGVSSDVLVGGEGESGSGRKGFGPFHFPGEGERVREGVVFEALGVLREELRKAMRGV